MITNTLSSTLSPVNYGQSTAALQPQSNASSQSSLSSTGTDSVQLSSTAQVSAMHQQGMNVNSIAANMGLTAAEVDSYLGITTASSSGGGHGAPAAAHAAPASKSTSASPSSTSTVKATTKK